MTKGVTLVGDTGEGTKGPGDIQTPKGTGGGCRSDIWDYTGAVLGILGVQVTGGVSQPPPSPAWHRCPEPGKVLQGGDRDKGGGSARVCVPGAPTGMR